MSTPASVVPPGEPGRPAPTSAPAAARNLGIPLDLDWIGGVRVNRGAVARRTATLAARRGNEKPWLAAWLLRAVTLTDLTTLAGDDTPGRVRQLCARARRPIPADLLERLGVAHLGGRVAAVCVYHAFIATAAEALEGSAIPVAAVSAGFPAGLSPFPQRVAEVRASVTAGAAEVDIVITRAHVLTGRWDALHDEVRAFRDAAGSAHLKAILATGELGTLRDIARAALVCMMAGADFIKTSTGKEAVNATLPAGLVMARAIRDYHERTGYAVGLKAAGGIRAARQALDWLRMVRDELGHAWLRPDRFRFGASALLDDIRDRLEWILCGLDPADNRPVVS